MNQENYYVIEVIQNNTNTRKTVYIDRFGLFGENSQGTPALRKSHPLPTILTEQEKDYVISTIQNAKYREMEDGRKCLPEIITRFGGMDLKNKEVDFTLNIYSVNYTYSVIDISFIYVESYKVKGVEGLGKHNRYKTIFNVESYCIT